MANRESEDGRPSESGYVAFVKSLTPDDVISMRRMAQLDARTEVNNATFNDACKTAAAIMERVVPQRAVLTESFDWRYADAYLPHYLIAAHTKNVFIVVRPEHIDKKSVVQIARALSLVLLAQQFCVEKTTLVVQGPLEDAQAILTVIMNTGKELRDLLGNSVYLAVIDAAAIGRGVARANNGSVVYYSNEPHAMLEIERTRHVETESTSVLTTLNGPPEVRSVPLPRSEYGSRGPEAPAKRIRLEDDEGLKSS